MVNLVERDVVETRLPETKPIQISEAEATIRFDIAVKVVDSIVHFDISSTSLEEEEIQELLNQRFIGLRPIMSTLKVTWEAGF